MNVRGRHGLRLVGALVVALIGAFDVGRAAAHEFWITPIPYQPDAAGSKIRADLRVGLGFTADVYPYLTSSFHSFRLVVRGLVYDIAGHQGDMPAIDIAPAPAGLGIIAYYGKPSTVTFVDAQVFASYLDLEGLQWVAKAHQARGLPPTGFVEAFSRNVKTLVQTGPVSPEDVDIVTGMPFELVAGLNPFADPQLKSLPVTLLWDGKPAPDLQIAIFQDTGNENGRTRTTLHTDPNGKALIPLTGGGRFILNAVHMREAGPELNAAWESHWASLTFELEAR